ncbi:hypothetical protein MPF_0080 [Methanohalophilus portucalensis FDF-1]|uniref:Uncharacterized protein n=1 Tax=Methanohalophilus portucalensis FDF-1 TaxID=523843 RepID=A0A1L9C6Z5_9EURY|nr:hypothetical protein MPF_0080 [Methanohalophilus portucalensis FDF-1]
MCQIEKFGYSQENKEIFCSDCIIWNTIGKCTFLQECESK